MRNYSAGIPDSFADSRSITRCLPVPWPIAIIGWDTGESGRGGNAARQSVRLYRAE